MSPSETAHQICYLLTCHVQPHQRHATLDLAKVHFDGRGELTDVDEEEELERLGLNGEDNAAGQ